MSNVRSNMMEAALHGLAPLAGTAVSAAPAVPVGSRPEEVARREHFDLLRRCQAREPGAFEELVRAFQPRVVSVIRSIIRHSNDIEDLAQQVFAKVYFALDHFNFQSSVATWIYKISVNECYDYLRKLKARPMAILADLSEEESARVENSHRGSNATGIEGQLAQKELAGQLLARVNLEDRILLVLKEIEGYSVREVAEILGMNENTAKVRLFRARQSLLSALESNHI